MAGQLDIMAGRAFVHLGLKDTGFERGVTSAMGRLRAFAAGAKDLGRSLVTMGAAIAAPLAAASRVYIGFTDQMAKLQAAANLSAAEFERVRTAIEGISRATGTGPTEVAAAMTELIKAGTSVEVALSGAAETVVKFARVAELDAATAATVVSDVLHVFAREGLSAAQAVDILAAAADASSIGLDQVTESFSMASAIAGQAGMSLADLAAAIGIMGNQGLKGSDAGTALKTMLISLKAPTDTGAKVIERFGLSLRDASGRLKQMPQIIEELNSKLGGLDEETRDRALKDLFGTDALRPALILMEQGVSGWMAFRGAMDQSLGVGEKFALLAGTLGGAMRSMLAALESVAVALGEALAPLLADWARTITIAAGLVTEWIKENQELVVTIVKLAATAVAVGAAIYGLGTALSAVHAIIAVLPAAVALLQAALWLIASHPVVATVVYLGVAFLALRAALRDTADATAEFSSAAEEALAAGDAARQADQARAARLEQLAAKQSLTNAEMEEAAAIIATLESRYGALGVRVNTATGAIEGMAGAQAKLNAAMREQAIRELEDQLAENQQNQREILAELQAASENGLFGYTQMSNIRAAELESKAQGYQSEHTRLIERLKALKGGSTAALTGDEEKAAAVGSAGESAAAIGDRIERDEEKARAAAELQKKLEDELREKRIQNIADEEARAMAAIKNEYTAKRRAILENQDLTEDEFNRALATISQQQNEDEQRVATEAAARRQREQEDADAQAQRAAEVAAREAEQLAERQADLEYQIAREEIEASAPEGKQRDSLLLELERERALAAAAKEGLDPARINRLYDVKQEALAAGATTSQTTTAGTFSAYQAALLGGSGSIAQKQLDEAKAARKANEQAVDHLENINENLDALNQALSFA